MHDMEGFLLSQTRLAGAGAGTGLRQVTAFPVMVGDGWVFFGHSPGLEGKSYMKGKKTALQAGSCLYSLLGRGGMVKGADFQSIASSPSSPRDPRK